MKSKKFITLGMIMVFVMMNSLLITMEANPTDVNSTTDIGANSIECPPTNPACPDFGFGGGGGGGRQSCGTGGWCPMSTDIEIVDINMS